MYTVFQKAIHPVFIDNPVHYQDYLVNYKRSKIVKFLCILDELLHNHAGLLRTCSGSNLMLKMSTFDRIMGTKCIIK